VAGYRPRRHPHRGKWAVAGAAAGNLCGSWGVSWAVAGLWLCGYWGDRGVSLTAVRVRGRSRTFADVAGGSWAVAGGSRAEAGKQRGGGHSCRLQLPAAVRRSARLPCRKAAALDLFGAIVARVCHGSAGGGSCGEQKRKQTNAAGGAPKSRELRWRTTDSERREVTFGGGGGAPTTQTRGGL